MYFGQVEKSDMLSAIGHRGDIKYNWTDARYANLQTLGWNFQPNNGMLPRGLIATHDVATPELLTRWRDTQQPVEVSIVIVAPDTTVDDLPIRSLAYAATALHLSDNLRRQGINLDTLRILSPCHANAYANNKNLDPQLANAVGIQRLVQAYKQSYLPTSLEPVQVTLDTGNPITPEIEAHFKQPIDYIEQYHPGIVTELDKAASIYGDGLLADTRKRRSILYLLAHPSAWGYSVEDPLFPPNGQTRINYMPASELRYLAHMIEIANGGAWVPARDKEIATVIAGQFSKAPYFLLAHPNWAEPTLGTLTKRDKQDNTHLTIQQLIADLKPHGGHQDAAEILTALGAIQYDMQQANFRAKRERTGRIPLFAEVIAAAYSCTT